MRELAVSESASVSAALVRSLATLPWSRSSARACAMTFEQLQSPEGVKRHMDAFHEVMVSKGFSNHQRTGAVHARGHRQVLGT